MNIEVENNLIQLQLIGKAIVFSYKLSEFSNLTSIISTLSAKDASSIGYHVGKYHHKTNHSDTMSNKPLFLKHGVGKYKMIYEDRDRNICYLNTKNREKFTRSPYEIFATHQLITKFDPSQAFYIGFLAGLTNIPPPRRQIENPPKLTLVK